MVSFKIIPKMIDEATMPRFEVKEPLRVLCCNKGNIDVGRIVCVYKKMSPNRLMVKILSHDDKGQLHKVKASSFRRCTNDPNIT